MIREYLNKFNKPKEKKSSSFLDLPYLRESEEDKAGADAYFKNIIVHRCVSLIAISASHVPWVVYKQSNLDKKHPINSLLQHPNADISGADFFTEVIANLLLYGNSYIVTTHSNNNLPSELHILRPNAVDLVSRKSSIVAYKYRTTEGEKIYPIDHLSRISRVLHLKNYHPTNHQLELSSLQAAAASINMHAKIMDWNKALLKNAARPSGALVFQDGNGYLTDEQFQRLQEQFYENFSGSSNSGKPLILEGGLKWQETNNAERFEKFIELKDSAARDIAIAFNVPPQLLGINGDNTYSNMQEARLALWEENIIPLLDKLSDAFSGWFSYWFNEPLRIDFDRDSISALTEKREDLWSKISNADFMTINEKRAFFGLEAIKGGDGLHNQKMGIK